MTKRAILMSLRRLHTLLLLEKRSNNLRSDLLKGMAIISTWPEDLSQLEPASTRVRFAELGPKFIKTYDELLTTGRIARLDELQAHYDPFYCFLCELPNFGQKMANRMFYDRLIESMDDLRLAFANGVLPKIPAFGEGRLKTIAKLLWLTPEGAEYPDVDWTAIGDDVCDDDDDDDDQALKGLEDFERPQLLIPRTPKRLEPITQRVKSDSQTEQPRDNAVQANEVDTKTQAAFGTLESEMQRQLSLDFTPKADLTKAVPKLLPLIKAEAEAIETPTHGSSKIEQPLVTSLESVEKTDSIPKNASKNANLEDVIPNEPSESAKTDSPTANATQDEEKASKAPSKGPKDHSGSLKLSEMPPKRTTSERKPQALHKISKNVGDFSTQKANSIIDESSSLLRHELNLCVEEAKPNDRPTPESLANETKASPSTQPCDFEIPRGAYGALACPKCKTWHAIQAHASQASYSLTCDHCKTRFLLRESILRLDLTAGEQSPAKTSLAAMASVFRKSIKSLSLGRNVLVALIEALRPCDAPKLRILQLGAAHDALFDCLYDVFSDENHKIIVVDESLWALRVAASTEAEQALICSPDPAVVLAPETYDRIVVDPLRYDHPSADLVAQLAQALKPKAKIAIFWPEDLSQDAITGQTLLRLVSTQPLGKGAILGLERV